MSVCGPNERGNVSSQLHGEASLIRPLGAAKEHPQLSTSDLQTSSLGYCLLSSRWSWTELLVREQKKKNTLFFFLQKNSNQYVSEAKNKEPGRKLQFVAFPLEGL